MKELRGLNKLCRLYGGMVFKGDDGSVIKYVWDYAIEMPRVESEMTEEEIKASEKAKYKIVKEQMKNIK